MRSLPPGFSRVVIAALYVSVIVLLSACGGDKGGASTEGTAKAGIQEPEKKPGGNERLTNVESLTLTPRVFSQTRDYIGHLIPRQRLLLKSENEGLVEKVFFAEGDEVKKGQILAHVANKQFTIRRNLARSNLELAKANHAREKKMRVANLIPQSQLDATRNRLEVARFSLDLAKLDVQKSVLRAPVSGFVKTRGLDAGEFARKGDLIAELLEIDRMVVLINVPEREVRFFSLEKPVTVVLNAVPGKTFNGNVKKIGLEADQKNRSFPVEVELANQEHQLRPGMLARTTVEVETFENQILIPRHAILERETRRVVFVVENGTVQERTIEIGASKNEEVQVLSGLTPGDALIVKGQQKLNPQEKVTVQKTSAQSPIVEARNEPQ